MSVKSLRAARSAGAVLAAGALILALAAHAYVPSPSTGTKIEQEGGGPALDRMIARFAAEARAARQAR